MWDPLGSTRLKAPRSAGAVGRLGMVFQAHDLHAEALACYHRASELDPEALRWTYLQALLTGHRM